MLKPLSTTIAALLAVPLCSLEPTSAPAAASPPAADSSSYEGTYFFESLTMGTGDAINGFFTLHKNGALTWADQSDFGAAGNFNSTTHGVWRKIGPRTVELVGYYYRFDASGIPVALIRITAVGSLEAGAGTGTVDVFGPDQNPVTEEPAVPGADTLTIHSYRLP